MISVVTITFNNHEELIETLDSIKNVSEIESIVINGGSSEETKEFLKTYNGKSITEPDHGISDAFNKGIALSQGDAIMFLNSGDLLIDASYLSDVNNFLKNNPEFDYFYSDLIYNDSIIGKKRITVGDEKRNLARGMPYPHQTLIITKRVFNKIGGFDLDLKIAMDFDLVLRMYQSGFTNKKYIPKASVLMDGTGVSSKQELKCIQEVQQVLKRYGQYNLKTALRTKLSIIFYFLKKNDFLKLLSKKLAR